MFTYEYKPSSQEQKLYDLLYAYINKPNKLAFPEMETYDLALRLLSLQSSSTAAIAQTVKGILKRLEKMPNAEEEIAQLQSVLFCSDSRQSSPPSMDRTDTAVYCSGGKGRISDSGMSLSTPNASWMTTL